MARGIAGEILLPNCLQLYSEKALPRFNLYFVPSRFAQALWPERALKIGFLIAVADRVCIIGRERAKQGFGNRQPTG